MIQQYIHNLITTLPKSQKRIEIDLILSGGMFNGAYTLGSLFYLKELEKKNIIQIKRISCSSVGSILGLLYLIDQLDLFYVFYDFFFNHFNKHKNLSILLSLKKKFYNNLSSNITQLVNHKLFISYYNIQKCKKYTKHHFTSKNKIIDCIIKSCYLPYFINYNLTYKNKYIDGMLPFFFQTQSNRKILYINVFTLDKLSYIINIKNEKYITHRIVSGINDIHMCLLKNQNTIMCSFVDNWSIYEYTNYYITSLIQLIIVYLLHLIILIFNFYSLQIYHKENSYMSKIHIQIIYLFHNIINHFIKISSTNNIQKNLTQYFCTLIFNIFNGYSPELMPPGII